MSYVPQYPDQWKTKGYLYTPAPIPAITVHAQKENKRPIGFLPWPEDEPAEEPAATTKPKKHKRKKAARKAAT